MYKRQQHKLLIEYTQACLDSAKDPSEAEGVLYIRDEIYQLIQLIPQSRIDVAKALFLSGGHNGFQFDHHTSAKETYQFFKTAIRDLYTDLETQMSMTTNTDYSPFQMVHNTTEHTNY